MFGAPYVVYRDIRDQEIGALAEGIVGFAVAVGLVRILVMQVIGFTVWSRKSISFSSDFVLIPTVILYGSAIVWLLMS